MKDIFAQLSEFVRRTWIILLVIAVVIVAGIASIETYKEEVLEIDPDVELTESKTLYFVSEEIDTLNPIISQSEDTYYISKMIYNSLFDYNVNMNVVKELVDEYTVNTDEGKISIELRTDVKWHDGEKLTASDVKFTVDAIKYAGKKSVYYDKVSVINYVTVTGDSSLEIVFKKKTDAALDNLTFPIVSSSSFASVSEAAKEEDIKPVGTGQYAYKSYNYLKELKLKPNEDYFGTVSKKSITISIVPDRTLAEELEQIDSVSCYIDESSERKLNAEDKELTLYDIPSNSVEMLVFNTKNEHVKEAAVRKAIAHCVDLEKVLENGYMGDGILTDTIYYPNFMGSTETGTYYTFDQTAAKTLLKGVGYEDRDSNGVIENEDLDEVRLVMVVNKNNATRLAAARLIEDQLEDAGFKITLKELSWDDYEDAIKKKEFDILVTGYSFNEQYDLRFLFNGKNDWKYKNEDLLEKVSQLEELHTTKEYSEIFSEVKAMLMDELPYYSLCYKQIGLVGGKYFEAEELPMFNDIYRNSNTWTWKYEKHEETDETKDNQ